MDVNGGRKFQEELIQAANISKENVPYKRVAFAGCGGSGKTTLANIVSSFLSWPHFDEGVRDYLKENKIEHLRKLSPEDTFKMQLWLLKRKHSTETSHKFFIADRSTADNTAYALRWCARDVNEKKMFKYVWDCCKHAQENYDLVIFLPWGKIPLEDDGTRSGNLMYQYEIDALIWGLLRKWKIPTYTINNTNIVERIKEAIYAIEMPSWGYQK